jgi:hypothetical protein
VKRSRRPLGLKVAPVVLAGATLLVGGCIVVSAVTTPVTLAATTVVVAGKTAGAVVTTTGKVASAAVNAGGSVASNGMENAAKLARAGMVTFVDATGGPVVRVPWQQGMTLAAASELAKVRAAQQSVAILRAGKTVYAAAQNPDVTVPVAAGDVVRLAK